MDPELYVAGAVEDDRGPVVEYSLQKRPTHLLWRVIEQRPDYGILWSFVGSDVTPHDFPALHDSCDCFIQISLTDVWKCTLMSVSKRASVGESPWFYSAKLRECVVSF